MSQVCFANLTRNPSEAKGDRNAVGSRGKGHFTFNFSNQFDFLAYARDSSLRCFPRCHPRAKPLCGAAKDLEENILLKNDSGQGEKIYLNVSEGNISLAEGKFHVAKQHFTSPPVTFHCSRSEQKIPRAFALGTNNRGTTRVYPKNGYPHTP